MQDVLGFESETQALETILKLLNMEGLQANKIDAQRRYWFVRTESGKYYDEFVLDEFIAIGWNEIPCVSKNKKEEDIIPLIEKYYPQVAHPARVMNQVRRFCTEMKIGDIVIIPKKGNAVLAFGIIKSDVENRRISEDDLLDDACPFVRKRSVRWIKGIEKHLIDPQLYQFLRNQHAISVADDYAPLIDRIMHNFYIKDGQAYFTLSVISEDEQRALDMPTFISGIVDRAKALALELNIPFSESDIKLRINVQSPGVSEKFGKPLTVALVALVVVALFGGSVKFKHEDVTGNHTSVDVGTQGLPHLIETIYKVNDKYDSAHPYNDKKLEQIVERAKIKDPRKERKLSTQAQDQSSEDDDSSDDQE